MPNEVLAKTVTRILRQPGVEKISFTLNALTVSGAQYGQVANAIDDGRITCELAASFEAAPGQLAPGTVIDAQYREKKNAMLFERQNFASTGLITEETSIVHEATHALFDLLTQKKGYRTLAIDDESAAFLAAALYIRRCGKNPKGWASFIDSPEYEALKLADQMIAAEADGQPFPLGPQTTQKLRDAVAKQYRFVRSADGTADDSGMKYVYDGVARCAAHGEQGRPVHR